tara:strand:+ start:442 stop:2277 length:1836 start_codon:yes stop_codon:yes gene_type:complete
MAESLKLQPLGLQFKVPETDFVGSRVQAQAMSELSANLDSMSNYLFKIAEQRAKIEGAEYGAKNAPTKQQIEDAYNAGEEIPIGGDKFTIYGSALRNAQLSSVSDELEYLARNKIVEITKNYNTNVEQYGKQTDEIKASLSPDNFATELDEIVAGYASTLDGVSPGYAKKFRAVLSRETNSKYLSYADKFIGEHNKFEKAKAIATTELFINNINTTIEGYFKRNENATELLKGDTKLAISSLIMNGVDVVGFNNRLIEAIRTSAKNTVIDELLAFQKPSQIIRDMYDGNFNALPGDIGKAMKLAKDYGINREDFVKQVNTELKQIKTEKKEKDDLERAENEEEINFAISDAVSFLAVRDQDSANKIMAPFIEQQKKYTSEELKEWQKISKAYEDDRRNNYKDDELTIQKLNYKLFSVDNPLTHEELTDAFAENLIGQNTFTSMYSKINSIGTQRMGEARRYILDQTNHDPNIRITDPNGDDALKERVYREIMTNVFEAELEAKLEGKTFSAILTAQNLYKTKGVELIANRIKFNRADALKVLQELATYSELQNKKQELMDKFAKATDQDLDGLLKDALEVSEEIIADRKTFGKININIAKAYPSRLSRMFK